MWGIFNNPVLFETGPAVNRPWQESWLVDAITVGTAIFLIACIWLWARSGRSKADNRVPFDHTAESFAGTVYAGYGPIPLFLVFTWAVIIISMVLYSIVSVINGVQY